jgi:hypothetical protein
MRRQPESTPPSSSVRYFLQRFTLHFGKNGRTKHSSSPGYHQFVAGRLLIQFDRKARAPVLLVCFFAMALLVDRI